MADYARYFQAVLRQPSPQMVEEFFTSSGRYSNFQKETCFIRYVSRSEYARTVARLRAWQESGAARQNGYVFAPVLSRQPDQADLERYVELYHGGDCKLPFCFENRILEEAFEAHFREILQLFRETRGRTEESIVRNFAVKLLCWIDHYFPRLFVETQKLTSFPKFACCGTIKLPEYLFLCLLYRMGCDVLYLGEEADVSIQDRALLELSVLIEEPVRREPDPGMTATRPDAGRVPVSTPRAPQSVRVSIPERAAAPAAAAQPLDYVELARMAQSVVMLKVFDAQQECFKTGSGVIINEEGYILTNFHVVAGGRYYGVLLEEEEDVFYTDELIKYHQDLDLAILRMQKRRKPIPVYRGETPLVRGQKVVAIGSPLGLFNTVSDGLISGFRTMGAQSMIQFTAPTSHGSSGGALLDLYGRLIGIITAGFDDGQNLNLAVDYQTILNFSRGLLLP